MLKYFRNRETMGYLMGSFLLVLVIFAFIVFYIPDFLGPAGGASPFSGEVARVDGIEITAQQFVQTYRRQEQIYRSQMGDRFSPALMRQLGLEDVVLQTLIQEALLVVEAGKQGLRVTDEELRDAILEDSAFRSNGQFVGQEAYLRTLAASGLTAQAFEEQLRQNLLRQKLRDLVLDGVLVDPEDAKSEYRRRNEKAVLEYIFVPAPTTIAAAENAQDEAEEEGTEESAGIEPISPISPISDDEVAKYFEERKEEYRLPLQRKIQYLTITVQPFLDVVNVSDREVERYYNQNIFLYEIPAQVRASHILFRIEEGADEAAVRRRAEEVLEEARAGGDFAELARTYSEDTASAQQGGDLNLFSRGEMVPEFEQAAFSLGVGEISDLVRSQFGLHIIKVTERVEPMTRPLESVREEIVSALKQEKATEMMEEAVQAAADFLRRARSLEAFVQERKRLELQETPFFGRQDQLAQLGGSAEIRQMAFELPIGEISPPVRLGNGYAFFKVLEERSPHIPPLEEVKERVREDLRQNRAMADALEKATTLKAKLEDSRSPEAVLEGEGLELKETESFYRGTQLPEVGRSPAVQDAAFSMEPGGGFSAPLPGNAGYVLLRVVSRSGYSEEEWTQARESFIESLLADRRQSMWSAYLQALQDRYSIQIDRETLRRLTS